MATSEQPAAFERGDLENYRPYLMRYALLQLRDATAAEDAVQDTLLAALQAGARYAGRASVRTWLTGILKHKIVDCLRRQYREQPLEHPGADEGGADAVADLAFAADGHWQEFPAAWGAPDASFESAQFWAIFEMCVQAMPARAARAFVMREVLELTTDDICRELGITATHCWVLLHRARLRLRECLEVKWFRDTRP